MQSPFNKFASPTGRSFRSPLGTPSTPDGSSIKKKQSSLKQLIQSYGKLLISWQKDTRSIKELLENLGQLQRSIDSIHKSVSTPILMRQRIFEKFPNLDQKLIALLTIDMENYCNLVKQYMHGLGDVFAAMQITANDTLNASLNEVVEIFPEDAIFNVDHILQVQRLQAQFSLEYQRKEVLLESLLTVLQPVEETQGPAMLSRTTLDTCCSSWNDDSEISCIDTSLLHAFVLQNVPE